MKNPLFIFWYIHKKCNFNCNYCYERDNNTKEIIPSVYLLDRVITSLTDINRQIIISLIGGEITLWEELNYLIKKLSNLSNICEIQVNTNGNIVNTQIQDNEKLRINLTIHPSQFSDNISSIFKYKNLHITIMFEPRYMSNIPKELLVKSQIKLIRDKNHLISSSYDNNQIKQYNELLNTYSIEDRKDRYLPDKFDYCTTGNQLRFDYNGSIYYNDFKCKKTLYNIYINPKDISKCIDYTYFKCPFDLCVSHNNCTRNIFKSSSLIEVQKYILRSNNV